MCTLTYIPTKTGLVLSSSRDELYSRPTLPPAKRKTLIYPKDLQAGGTWFAANQKGSLACLLNGAFEHYIPKKKYPKSRGHVVLERFNYKHPSDFWKNISLEGIESFTLICIETKPAIQIFEFIWDEITKYEQILPSDRPFIRSSATLYDENSKAERKRWFQDWIEKYQDADDRNITEFHNHPQDHSKKNSISILRENGLQTVSLSQFNLSGSQILFKYEDYISGGKTIIEI